MTDRIERTEAGDATPPACCLELPVKVKGLILLDANDNVVAFCRNAAVAEYVAWCVIQHLDSAAVQRWMDEAFGRRIVHHRDTEDTRKKECRIVLAVDEGGYDAIYFDGTLRVQDRSLFAGQALRTIEEAMGIPYEVVMVRVPEGTDFPPFLTDLRKYAEAR